MAYVHFAMFIFFQKLETDRVLYALRKEKIAEDVKSRFLYKKNHMVSSSSEIQRCFNDKGIVCYCY
jgi:hypothetical protein